MTRLQSTSVLAGLAFAAATGAAMAHHSFAMFDMEHPIEISGTVKEFRFVSPHTILILQVKGADGVVKDWTGTRHYCRLCALNYFRERERAEV